MPRSFLYPVIRDKYDLDPSLVENYQFVHKMLDEDQKVTDSNEREMIGARELIVGSQKIIKNSNFVLHLENINAAIIFSKGSSKFRLHKYALEIDNLSIAWNFNLKTVAIPRSLNNFSDKISKCLDYEDYKVSDSFYDEVSLLFDINCNYDRFANNFNTRTVLFNSASFCVGTSGVDCFNYNWGLDSLNWLFPPPRLIIRAVNHLQQCKGVGLLLTPEWKSAHFFPFLISSEIKRYTVKTLRFHGKNVFISGSDKTSYFGPNFNCGVVVWHLNFQKF